MRVLPPDIPSCCTAVSCLRHSLLLRPACCCVCTSPPFNTHPPTHLRSMASRKWSSCNAGPTSRLARHSTSPAANSSSSGAAGVVQDRQTDKRAATNRETHIYVGMPCACMHAHHSHCPSRTAPCSELLPPPAQTHTATTHRARPPGAAAGRRTRCCPLGSARGAPPAASQMRENSPCRRAGCAGWSPPGDWQRAKHGGGQRAGGQRGAGSGVRNAADGQEGPCCNQPAQQLGGSRERHRQLCRICCLQGAAQGTVRTNSRQPVAPSQAHSRQQLQVQEAPCKALRQLQHTHARAQHNACCHGCCASPCSCTAKLLPGGAASCRYWQVARLPMLRCAVLSIHIHPSHAAPPPAQTVRSVLSCWGLTARCGLSSTSVRHRSREQRKHGVDACLMWCACCKACCSALVAASGCCVRHRTHLLQRQRLNGLLSILQHNSRQ